MDNAFNYLAANLPPGVLDHVTNHGKTYWAVYQQFLGFKKMFFNNFLFPINNYFFYPLVSRLVSNPDVTTIVLLLMVIALSLFALDMFVRTIMWWIRLIRSLIVWGAVIAVGMLLWQRGLSGAVNDLDGWRATWSQNYQHWQQQEMNARRANGAGVHGTQGAWWAG